MNALQHIQPDELIISCIWLGLMAFCAVLALLNLVKGDEE